MDKIIKKMEALKLEHELPNDNTGEYNFGYVKAICTAMHLVKELNLDLVRQQRELLIEFAKQMSFNEMPYEARAAIVDVWTETRKGKALNLDNCTNKQTVL